MGEIKKGYKQTDIGVIPEDWNNVTVEEIIKEISMGPFGSDIKVSNFVSEGIPVLNGYSVSDKCLKDDFSNYVTPEKAKSLKKAVAKRGDVVVTHRGTIGQISYIPSNSLYKSYVISQSQFRVTLDKLKVIPSYIVLYFHSEKGQSTIQESKGHTGVPAIAQPTTTFRKFIIPLPSLAQQITIVNTLSDVDNLIAALDKKITKKQQIKQGAMQQLLTGKKRLPGFRGNSGFKHTELGLIPEDWEVIELGEVSSNIGYGVGAAAISYDGENKYIRITDIDERTRKFSPSPLSSPTFFLDSFHVNEGDILFARTGASVGKSYLYNKNDGRLIFAGFLIRFNIVNAIPEYVYYHTFTRKYNEWILAESARTGQPGVNVEQLKSFQIPFPKDLAEQTAIAQVLTDMDNEISQLEADRNKYEQIKAGMMQQLLTGKIRLT